MRVDLRQLEGMESMGGHLYRSGHARSLGCGPELPILNSGKHTPLKPTAHLGSLFTTMSSNATAKRALFCQTGAGANQIPSLRTRAPCNMHPSLQSDMHNAADAAAADI